MKYSFWNALSSFMIFCNSLTTKSKKQRSYQLSFLHLWSFCIFTYYEILCFYVHTSQKHESNEWQFLVLGESLVFHQDLLNKEATPSQKALLWKILIPSHNTSLYILLFFLLSTLLIILNPYGNEPKISSEKSLPCWKFTVLSVRIQHFK